MSFHPGAIAGADQPLGRVDFRLVRNRLLDEYRRGRLGRNEVCDAHPELVRAATHASRETKQDCPVCTRHKLVLVTYAFGPRLPKHGRVVATKDDMIRVRRSVPQCTCYVVEVCRSCGWNHLMQTFEVEGLR